MREAGLGERGGVAIAIVSSSLGGTAAAVTRYLVGDADPLTLAILRWGIGFLCVLPIALLMRVEWPRRGGQRTRRRSAVGKRQRKPMPQRRMASVIASALPTR